MNKKRMLQLLTETIILVSLMIAIGMYVTYLQAQINFYKQATLDWSDVGLKLSKVSGMLMNKTVTLMNMTCSNWSVT